MADVGKFREWMQGDEIVRVTHNEDLQFGRIIDQNIDHKSFKVLWKSRTSVNGIFEDNYSPDDHNDKVVQLVDRQHHEGEKVIHGEDGKIGEIMQSKVIATVYVPDLRCIIQGVPMTLLTTSSTLSTGERIFFKGWIGKVSCVKYNVLLEYRDGTRGFMEMDQHVKSNVSFGYQTYSKSTQPFPGIMVKPRPDEFSTMEWIGSGIVDSIAHLFNSHKGETCKVIRSNVKRVHVKWLCPLNEEPGPAGDAPKTPLESQDLQDVVDFDIQFKDWMKTHSICQYTIREEDEGIDENAMESRFIKNITSNLVGPRQEVKRLRLNPEPGRSSGYKAPVPGDQHFVEVIRLHHAYWVDWARNGGGEEEMCEEKDPNRLTGYKLESGCELSPYSLKLDEPYPRLEPFKLHNREFVSPKFVSDEVDDVRNLIGVTQHRDLKNELYLVDFYGEVEDDERIVHPKLFLERREIPKFDLYKHCAFEKLKPGAVVSKRGEISGIEHNVGTVWRVDQGGTVEVNFGKYLSQRRPTVCSPWDLIVKDSPEEDNMNSFSCFGKCMGLGCELDAERVDFAECVANDLREFLDNEINRDDIRIKQKLPGNIASLSVLMTGPKGTPYEHGLFVFDVDLPPAYPTVPPLIKLQSLPPCGAFLSYHFAPDWTVLHPRYKNWEPENSKSRRWGWTRTLSLLDFLQEIREDVFAIEPILEKVGLRFKNKETVFRPATKLTIKAISKNAEIVVTTLDMLIVMKNSIKKEVFWATEIMTHYDMVKPLLKTKLEYWMTTPCGVYGDTSMIPKFQIFPISSGFRRALARRIAILAGPSNNGNDDDLALPSSTSDEEED